TTPFRSSKWSTPRISATCVSRSISGAARCERSPRPVWVGVKSSCPRARSSGRIFFQAQPADQAPCATRNVAIAEFSLRLSVLFVWTRNDTQFFVHRTDRSPDLRQRDPVNESGSERKRTAQGQGRGRADFF